MSHAYEQQGSQSSQSAALGSQAGFCIAMTTYADVPAVILYEHEVQDA